MTTVNFAQLLFENERVRVWDFRLPSRQSATIDHACPTIRWQVDQGFHSLLETVSSSSSSSKIAGAPSEIKKEKVNDRQVFFVEKGTTWNVKNEFCHDTYRQIVFEILNDQPKYSQEKVQELLRQAKYSTNVGTELLLENELCRVWDFYLGPGEGGGPETVHQHCLDYVFVNVTASRLMLLHPDTLSLTDLMFDSVSEENRVVWNTISESAALDHSFVHGGKNGYDDRPMREYLVELK